MIYTLQIRSVIYGLFFIAGFCIASEKGTEPKIIADDYQQDTTETLLKTYVQIPATQPLCLPAPILQNIEQQKAHYDSTTCQGIVALQKFIEQKKEFVKTQSYLHNLWYYCFPKTLSVTVNPADLSLLEWRTLRNILISDENYKKNTTFTAINSQIDVEKLEQKVDSEAYSLTRSLPKSIDITNRTFSTPEQVSWPQTFCDGLIEKGYYTALPTIFGSQDGTILNATNFTGIKPSKPSTQFDASQKHCACYNAAENAIHIFDKPHTTLRFTLDHKGDKLGVLTSGVDKASWTRSYHKDMPLTALALLQKSSYIAYSNRAAIPSNSHVTIQKIPSTPQKWWGKLWALYNWSYSKRVCTIPGHVTKIAPIDENNIFCINDTGELYKVSYNDAKANHIICKTKLTHLAFDAESDLGACVVDNQLYAISKTNFVPPVNNSTLTLRVPLKTDQNKNIIQLFCYKGAIIARYDDNQIQTITTDIKPYQR